MKTLVVYHKEDNDGIFSGAIIVHYLVNVKKYDRSCIDQFPADYVDIAEFAKQHTPEELRTKYDSIYISDMSFPAEYIMSLYDIFGTSLFWFDHHKPIIDKVNSYPHGKDICGMRTTEQSALASAFKYLYSNVPMHELLCILSAWDSFTYEKAGFTQDYVYTVNKGINAKYNLDFDKIYQVIDDIVNMRKYDISDAYNIGKSIVDYENQVNANLIKDYKTEFIVDDTRIGCALFIQGPSSSRMFSSLKNDPTYANGIIFKRKPDGNWVISLYNINEEDTFHCGQYLAKKYNGGGHSGAAGCTIDQDTFINILRNKKL